MALPACGGDDATGNTGVVDADTDTPPVDDDEDGFFDDVDCDDGDAAINPDATEICDGIDNDGDGIEGADGPLVSCDAPSGTYASDDDCDTDSTGESLASADFDGDGNPELVISQPAYLDSAGYYLGRIFIVSGD